jgi:hypothetical protein
MKRGGFEENLNAPPAGYSPTRFSEQVLARWYVIHWTAARDLTAFRAVQSARSVVRE